MHSNDNNYKYHKNDLPGKDIIYIYYINCSNNESMPVDEIDLEIIRSLVDDARVSLKELAERTGLAVSSVRNRIAKLVSRGTIERFTVLINPDKFEYVTAFILLNVDAKNIINVIEFFAKRDFVLEVYEVLGRYNVMCKLRVKDLKVLKSFIDEVQNLKGITDIEIYISVRRHKESVWKP